MNGLNQSLCKFVACAIFVLGLASCSGGGSDGGGTTTPPAPASGSVTLTGTVSGSVIKVLRANTSAVITTADTASLVNPPFPFTLSKIPTGVPIKAFFFSAGETFPFYLGNTNVFTVLSAGTFDLGFVVIGGGRANPTNQPSNVTLGAEDLSPLPPGIEPPPATLLVMTPAPATGSVIVEFAVQNFSIGGQGQSHLHIRVDNGSTRHFFNGQTNKVLDGNGQATTDVVRQNTTSFRLNGLAPGQHSVTARLSTASDNEFVNPEAEPAAVPITITIPPVPPPTLTITNPLQGASLPSGPVLVSFTVQDFIIGGQRASHLHIYLDGGPANHFHNAPTNQVLDGNGQVVANVTRQSNTSFQITGLSSGPHAISLRLADGAEQELQNAESEPPDLNFNIQALPGNPTLTINSPSQGAQLQPGSMLISFTIQNSPVTTSTQPRMRFYVDDNNSVLYKFYDGQGITEDGSTSGVRYQNVHTHFVHWKSGNSIQFNALASGPHRIRFVLVDQSEVELPATTQTLAFTVVPGTGGAFSLQEVVGNLDFPVPMAPAPDGRIFVGELSTGNIRVVIPTPSLPWRLQSAPFATVPAGNAEGLLGLAVDPDFATNGYVYAFHPAGASVNRVVRFRATVTNGNTVAESPTPLIILDNIPASSIHNGGVLQFGPDGKLYVFVGDAENPANSQQLTSLAGKILRINTDGSAPGDNPFISNANANAKKVFSLGHRNSLGFAFHPHTDDLWQTENGNLSDDEVNRIVPASNYGWPLVEGIASTSPYIDPILALTPSVAPTGIAAIREDSVYPAQYHNNLLFGDFNNGFLHRIVLGGVEMRDLVTHNIACDCGRGPLFSVMHGLNVTGQDGFIYVTTTTGISRVVLNSP